MAGCGRWQGPGLPVAFPLRKLSGPSHRERAGGWGAAWHREVASKALPRAERRTGASASCQERDLLCFCDPPQKGPSRHPLRPCPRSPESNMVLFLTAEALAVPAVTGTFLVGSASDSSALPCLSPPAVFNKEPASSQSWLEEPVLMPGTLGTWRGEAALPRCLGTSLPASPILRVPIGAPCVRECALEGNIWEIQ